MRERDWQPIETAPKDGTNVLLWWPFWCKGRPTIGYFGFHGIQQWAAPECLEGDGDPPTHWMPLPAGPGAAPVEAARQQDDLLAALDALRDQWEADSHRSQKVRVMADRNTLRGCAGELSALLTRWRNGEAT